MRNLESLLRDLEKTSSALEVAAKSIADLRSEIMKNVDQPPNNGPKCMIDTCSKLVKHRGLCSSHYQDARRSIREGEVKETDLVSVGLMLPAKKGGRPFKSTFREILLEKKLVGGLESYADELEREQP